MLSRDLPVMGVLTGALFVMCYGFPKPGQVTRLEGTVLLTTYIGYNAVPVSFATPESCRTASCNRYSLYMSTVSLPSLSMAARYMPSELNENTTLALLSIPMMPPSASIFTSFSRMTSSAAVCRLTPL